ncbi:Cu-Zn family superoxide dismutase [Prauserella shujinwangii]|uniref:Cu-Zn family superoxide dismutase n=1 Tax=Prauserella shujinwangii TaxID=1453103 RepID=A0A2T0LN14_9PSEU|nr:superoxide dismutase [Prauserella shujinwangii]PRX44511.1 Cu-Zn family superoxide dismutase [Prauserella shujinwangii]
MRRRLLSSLGTVLAAAALALPGTGQAAASEAPITVTHGTFGDYAPGRTAVTYDSRVPEGARATVVMVSAPGLGTRTVLHVAGLVPHREYGAHAHTQPCGPTGSAAGPHFQHVPGPSDDPAYANPENEIWLDFTTGPRGHAVARSHVDWTFDERRPRSIVIHEHHTSTAPGEAGSAGTRLACVDL